MADIGGKVNMHCRTSRPSTVVWSFLPRHSNRSSPSPSRIVDGLTKIDNEQIESYDIQSKLIDGNSYSLLILLNVQLTHIGSYVCANLHDENRNIIEYEVDVVGKDCDVTVFF